MAGKWIVLMMVCLGTWMDIKTRTIGGWFFLVFGVIGLFFVCIQERQLKEWMLSSLAGIILLLFSRMSGGEIGEGDGWFFVITGLFLNPYENIWLFVSGLGLCIFTGLLLVVNSLWKGIGCRKLRLPFLPFLLPGSVCLAFF